MSRTIQGQIQEHLTVDEYLTVQGSVEGGATVRGHLVVQGQLSGEVLIESGGIVTCQGMANASFWIKENGSLLVAGMWNGEILEHGGNVGIAAGTLFSQQVLDADGTLRPVVDGEKLSVNAGPDGYLALHPDGHFVRLRG